MPNKNMGEPHIGWNGGYFVARGTWGALVLSMSLALAVASSLLAQVTYHTFPAEPPRGDVVQPSPHGSAATVTLIVRDSSIAYAIKDLARQAHLRTAYYTSDPRYAKRVTVHLIKVNVMDAFDIVLRGTGLRTKLTPDGETVVISGMTGDRTRDTTGAIEGRVTDSTSGRGLSGATVKVQGNKLSAMTSDSGYFLLPDVPVGDQVLTVRLFGYRPVTRVVTATENGPTNVRITMRPVPTVLSGVVTTATGVQRKLEVGNDITTLNVDSIRQVAPITSVTDLLESRVPGLTVLHSSGTPGDPARLRLRGPKSITGSNDPIVIVDGIRVYAAQSDQRAANLAGSAVPSTATFKGQTITTGINNVTPAYTTPSPLDQLDPNSIETIEVLKGPSASSLYGSDAANGVIVIATKKGRAGPTHWSTALGQGLSYLPGTYPVQTIRWAHGPYSVSYMVSRPCDITEALGCDVLDSITHLQTVNLPRWSPFGHGNTTSGSVTVSGGTQAMTYALTGSAANDLGYLKLPDAMAEAFQQFHGYEAPGWAKRPDKYTTWGGSGQLTALPSTTVQLTFQSNLFHGVQQRSSLEGQLPDLLSVVDTICGNGFATCGTQTLATRNAYERATDEQLTLNNAVTASWVPWAWLPLTGTAGLNLTTGHDIALLARNIVPYIPNGSSGDTLGRYGTAQKSALLKTLTVNTLMPGWRGRLKTALGVNIYSQSSSDLVSEQDSLALGVNTPSTLSHPSTQFAVSTATYGWFFEPRLALSDRFFLTPGFRLDGGNANGSRASASGLPAHLTFAALFPKVNFSWVALDRQEGEATPFLGALTLLRPRLALGSAGVQPNPGDQLRLLTFAGSSTLGVSGAAGGIQTLGNTQLRPERSSEVEGGFDAELWHGRLAANVTHSRQIRHDAIISVPVAPSVYGGGMTIALNIGDIRNTSTEVSGSIRPIETSALSWTIGGNWSRNDNVVLKLDQNSTPILAGGGIVGVNGTKVAVGYPLFGRWDRPILSYLDDNHDGIIETNEIRYGDTAVYLGRQDPAYTAAITTDLTVFQGRLGLHANMSQQGGYAQLNGSGSGRAFLSSANERHAPLGEQAGYVAAATGQSYYSLVQTVNSWEFQSLSVNYVVPLSVAQHFHARAMSIALQGSNLGLWTTYRGKDPNVNAYSNGNATADLGQLAQPRTWRLQLTLGN